MTLAEVATRYPEFEVNLARQVLASKYVQALELRFAAFGEAQLEARPWVRVEREVLAALRSSLAQEVAAYADLVDVCSLRDLPLIDKQTLREQSDRYQGPAASRFGNRTSGTTGRPVYIAYDLEFYFDFFFLAIPKVVDLAGVEIDEGRPLYSLSLTDNAAAGEWIMADPRLPTRLGVQVVVDERRGETIQRFWRLSSELRPAVVTVKPSLLEALVAERTARRPSCSPDLVLSSGALLPEALRKEAEGLFGCAVTNAYGMTEFGLMAAECEYREGLHVDESALAIEQVEGELVASSVSNRAMPLLRYRTADLGDLARGRCRCGRTSSRLRALTGRRVRSFRLDSEELLSPARFNRLFEHPALREFQLTQVAPLRFELSVELEPNCDPTQVLPAVEWDARLIFDREVDLRLRLGGLEKDGKFERYRCAF